MTPRTLVELSCRTGDQPGAASVCSSASAIAAAVVQQGVEPGARVAAALADETLFAAALIGVTAARAVFVPLDVDAGADEIRMALHRAGVRVLVTADGASQPLRSAAASLGIEPMLLALDDRGRLTVDGDHVYESHARVPEPHDAALLTGDGPPLTHEALVAAAQRLLAERPGSTVTQILAAVARSVRSRRGALAGSAA